MTLELSAGGTDFLGERWIVHRLPGRDGVRPGGAPRPDGLRTRPWCVLMPRRARRALAAAPRLPHAPPHPPPALLNGLEEGGTSVSELLDRAAGRLLRPLVLREMPLREGGRMVGLVDLVSERAWGSEAKGRPALIPLPDAERPREEAERRQLSNGWPTWTTRSSRSCLDDVVPLQRSTGS